MTVPCFTRRRPRLVEIATGEQYFFADSHRDNGKRFVAHADEKVTAFLEVGSGDSLVRGLA